MKDVEVPLTILHAVSDIMMGFVLLELLLRRSEEDDTVAFLDILYHGLL
jgi:hypothetical protein